MDRPKITVQGRNKATDDVGWKVIARLKEKGDGAFVSRHEVLGVVVEEYAESLSAVQNGTQDDVYDELLDIAVACVLGMACMHDNSLDW